jgi:hypothetical protein
VRRVSNPQLLVGDETVDGMTAILGYARVSTTGQDSKNRPFFAR